MKRYVLIILSLAITTIFQAQILKTQVGLTRYDLQTNNSIQRRIVIDPATNKMVITYTGSMDADDGSGAFANRGTGYYYFNGTGSPPVQTSFPTRPENTRVGWPNPLFLAGGKEAIISHNAGTSANGLHIITRGTIGSGTWANGDFTQSLETWPRAGNSGDSIFVITSVSQASGSAQIAGMTGGIGFKRSYNGGTSWLPVTGLDTITGINVNNYPNSAGTNNVIGGDQYALDVKGATVAVLTGSKDVTLYKSTDFGNTWTIIPIIIGDNNSTGLPSDNRPSGDFSVLIDNAGKVHCFWGRAYGDGSTYSLASSGIMYWNENMPANTKPKIIYQTLYLKDGAKSLINLPFWTSTIFGARDPQTSYGSTQVSSPSSGIDASGNIYLSFMRLRGISDTSRFISGKQTDAANMMLNDVYVVKSLDGGATWKGPLNVSNSDSMESSFPSMARFVDNNVHLVYQEDTLYGYAIGNTLVSHNGIATSNKQIYAKVPVADIVSPTDITPPMLQKMPLYSDTFQSDTFKFCSGSNTILNTVTGISLSLTNVQSFVESHLAVAYDNETIAGLIRIDTPDGVNLNTSGVKRIRVYAKDAAGNVSNNFYKIPTTTPGDTLFYDTIKFYISVQGGGVDVTPPTFTFSAKKIFHYLGTPFTTANMPTYTIQDDNLCSTTSITTVAPVPAASDVDANTIGKYTLVYRAKDGANNIGTDTVLVYVSKEPKAVIINESISTGTGGKIQADGSTSTNLLKDLGETNTSEVFKWTAVKKNTSGPGSVVKFTFRNAPMVDTPTSKVSAGFDSLCLELTNLYNNAPFNKPKSRVCRPLFKIGSSIQNITDNSVSVEIFPNPNNGVFNILVNGMVLSKDAFVTISDATGRLIMSESYHLNATGILAIRNDKLSKGNYIVTTEIDNRTFSKIIEIK